VDAAPFNDLRQNLRGRASDFQTPSWRSDLIANDPQLFFFLVASRKIVNREISTASGVDPSRPKYQVRHASATDGLFAGELSFPVRH